LHQSRDGRGPNQRRVHSRMSPTRTEPSTAGIPTTHWHATRQARRPSGTPRRSNRPWWRSAKGGLGSGILGLAASSVRARDLGKGRNLPGEKIPPGRAGRSMRGTRSRRPNRLGPVPAPRARRTRARGSLALGTARGGALLRDAPSALHCPCRGSRPGGVGRRILPQFALGDRAETDKSLRAHHVTSSVVTSSLDR
jgi:hypothetical protein